MKLLGLTLWLCIGLITWCTNAEKMTCNRQDDESCIALIEYEINKADDMISIEAKAINKTESHTTFSYKLKVLKTGPSGTSSNTQGGSVDAAPNDTATLSSQKLDYIEGNKYELKLEISSKDGTRCKIEKTLSYTESGEK